MPVSTVNTASSSATSADDLTSGADSLAMVARRLGLDPVTAHHALDHLFRRI